MDNPKDFMELMNDEQRTKFYKLRDETMRLHGFMEAIENKSNEFHDRFFRVTARKELIYFPENIEKEFDVEFQLLGRSAISFEKDANVYADLKNSFFSEFEKFVTTKRITNKEIDGEMDSLLTNTEKIFALFPKMNKTLESKQANLDVCERILNDYSLKPLETASPATNEMEFTPEEIHIVQSLMAVALKDLEKQNEELKENGMKAKLIPTKKRNGMIKTAEEMMEMLAKVKANPNSLFQMKDRASLGITMFFIDSKTFTEKDPDLRYPSVVNKIQTQINFIELQGADEKKNKK